MNHYCQDIVLVIPTLEPTQALPDYVTALQSHPFYRILIVNDGSGNAYEPVFAQLRGMPNCTVIGYEINQGKGFALKTAYRYIQENAWPVTGVITADSDGQHSVADVCRLAACLAQQERQPALLLGTRDFSSAGVPFKSRFGNRFSSLLCWAGCGTYLSDTQTGLRAFDANLLPEMIASQGERFEYEMQVIRDCLHHGIPMKQVPIQTIYTNNNAGSHFKVVHDTLRVVKVLLSQFFSFMISSLLSALVDLSLAFCLLDFLKNFVAQDLLRIALATVIARLVSMCVNFMINRHFVFQGKRTAVRAPIVRYSALCAVVMLLSTALVYITTTAFFWNEKIAKTICDAVLFLFSYQMQKVWVFAKAKNEKEPNTQ